MLVQEQFYTTTDYWEAVQHALFSDYLRAELRQPHIPAFSTA